MKSFCTICLCLLTLIEGTKFVYSIKQRTTWLDTHEDLCVWCRNGGICNEMLAIDRKIGLRWLEPTLKSWFNEPTTKDRIERTKHLEQILKMGSLVEERKKQ